MDKAELLNKAIQIATKAHAGQTDKAGADYILHPKRVAEHCSSLDEKIVAILHDTLEDSNTTPQQLLSCGFPNYIVDAVVSVTKEQQESYTDFVLRAKANPIGRVVKINDLLDNMDLSRLSTVTATDTLRLKKYIDALRLLID